MTHLNQVSAARPDAGEEVLGAESHWWELPRGSRESTSWPGRWRIEGGYKIGFFDNELEREAAICPRCTQTSVAILAILSFFIVPSSFQEVTGNPLHLIRSGNASFLLGTCTDVPSSGNRRCDHFGEVKLGHRRLDGLRTKFSGIGIHIGILYHDFRFSNAFRAPETMGAKPAKFLAGGLTGTPREDLQEPLLDTAIILHPHHGCRWLDDRG